MKDGGRYFGQFKNDCFNGRGALNQSDGCIYWGDWLNGQAHGYGVFFDPVKRALYEGDWVNDKQHGRGKETWNAGEVTYEGNFDNGQKNGQGRLE